MRVSLFQNPLPRSPSLSVYAGGIPPKLGNPPIKGHRLFTTCSEIFHLAKYQVYIEQYSER